MKVLNSCRVKLKRMDRSPSFFCMKRINDCRLFYAQHFAERERGVARNAVEAAKCGDCGSVAAGNLAQCVALAHFVGFLGAACAVRVLFLADFSRIFGVGFRRVVARFGICLFVESVVVGMGCLVGEVEYTHRVDCISHKACLEVEMRAGASSGASA